MQLAAVLDALDADTQPPVGSAGPRTTLELPAATFASGFTGRPVRRGELGPAPASMAGGGAPWPPRT